MAKVKEIKLEEYRDQFVPVFSTEKNPYYPEGTKVMVHPDMAKHLVQIGMMTDQDPEGYEEEPEEGEEE
jgi:hypothetical protein